VEWRPWGPLLAEALTAEQHPYDAYGAGTPYARLVELGGRLALVGASLETLTLVYHAEAVAEVPGKRRLSYGMPVIVGGERLWWTGPSRTSTPLRQPRLTSQSIAIRLLTRAASETNRRTKPQPHAYQEPPEPPFSTTQRISRC
jgi:hypothetical protein